MGLYDNKAPYKIDLLPGTHHLCQCGKTGNIPLCDGSHKGTGKTPLKFEITEPKTVYICGCGKSGKIPFCDGSHSKP